MLLARAQPILSEVELAQLEVSGWQGQRSVSLGASPLAGFTRARRLARIPTSPQRSGRPLRKWSVFLTRAGVADRQARLHRARCWTA